MRIYLDHNATTPIDPRVRERWLAWMDEGLGNPSSLHRSGRRARALIDAAREQAAAALGVHEDELFFTAGGTEAINLALLGSPAARSGPGALLGFTAIEHSAVLECVQSLAKRGCRVHRIPVDSAGFPRMEPEFDALRGAQLVGLPWANGEIGSVWPVAELVQGLRATGCRALIFSDLVQAVGRLPVAPAAAGIDLGALSGHKLGGPPGVGLLYARRGSGLTPQLFGGGQEAGLRPGTEDAARIAAFALALELAVREQPERALRCRAGALWLCQELQRLGFPVQLNGPGIDAAARLPNTLNIAAPGGDGKVLVMRLDLEGLEVSAGSACASGSLEPSHVLRALGQGDLAARRGLRISLSAHTSPQELSAAATILVRVLSERSAGNDQAETPPSSAQPKKN
jgi:cysteine desulfurase